MDNAKPDTPSDPSLKTVELAGGPISYSEAAPPDDAKDAGDAAVVLAVHGLPGGAWDWRWLGAVLEPSMRLIRVEQPGFGASPLATFTSADFTARADLMVRVADALSVERFIVMGHSIGGPLALAMAARHPDRVAGLALIASVGLSPHKVLRANPIFRQIAIPLAIPGVRALLLPKVRSAYKSLGFKRVTDSQIRQTSRIVRALDFGLNARHAAQIRAPTFVAWAADDALIEPAIGETLGAALPPGPRLCFEGGGHTMQATRALPLGEALTAWVSATWNPAPALPPIRTDPQSESP